LTRQPRQQASLLDPLKLGTGEHVTDDAPERVRRGSRRKRGVLQGLPDAVQWVPGVPIVPDPVPVPPSCSLST
jgi:hypothetical protein